MFCLTVRRRFISANGTLDKSQGGNLHGPGGVQSKGNLAGGGISHEELFQHALNAHSPFLERTVISGGVCLTHRGRVLITSP